jgi:hypothetical protein
LNPAEASSLDLRWWARDSRPAGGVAAMGTRRGLGSGAWGALNIGDSSISFVGCDFRFEDMCGAESWPEMEEAED